MAEYNMQKQPLLVVTGPTASGKSALAVELCKRYNGELVSCDSMQVYRGMEIATAQPTQQERQGVPHHLIGILPPDAAFSVVDYCERARACIADIALRGKLPVLAGGTGLYLDALVNHIDFSPAGQNPAVREHLQERAAREGAQGLLDELRQLDAETAQALHPNNLGRIIRALEIYETTGEKPSVYRKQSRLREPPYHLCMLGLDVEDRAVLYQRIDSRVDAMLAQGLLEEAKRFFALPHAPTARQAIGYKELKPYLDGDLTLEQACENLKRETRRYAKRQLTWLRREERLQWLMIDKYLDIQALTDEAQGIISGAIVT